MYQIREATHDDIPGLLRLLYQVGMVHHQIRPDLFRANATKYSEDQLQTMITLPQAPIFVCVNEEKRVLGYAFCVLQTNAGDSILTPIKTLYIDDLCVDERVRGQHIGRSIYEYDKTYARSVGCYNVTLNVWEGNDSALAFYRSMGMWPQKHGMECIL